MADLRCGTCHRDHFLCQLENGKLDRIPEVDRACPVRTLHHPDHPLDQVAHILERPGMASVAIDRDVLVFESLQDKVGHDASVIGLHARAYNAPAFPPSLTLHMMAGKVIVRCAKKVALDISFAYNRTGEMP